MCGPGIPTPPPAEAVPQVAQAEPPPETTTKPRRPRKPKATG